MLPAYPIQDIVNQWPVLQPAVESRYFSSFDRTGGNDDGFNGTYSTLYVADNGEHVIYDALGPGCLRTLWFTSDTGGYDPLKLGKLRFYFDDDKTARITIDATDLYEGKTAPFLSPLVANNHISTGGFASWVPLPYAKRLRITTESSPFFYISQYDTYPVGTKLASWKPGDIAEQMSALYTHAGSDHGASKDVPSDYAAKGSGVVELIRFKPAHHPTKEQLLDARIRIWWDGEAKPAVDSPLGMFFGSGLGEAKVAALGFSMANGVYENHFPMPFWKGFHIEVTGLEGQLAVRVGAQRYTKQTSGHFHAEYNLEHPTTIGRDFVMLETAGAGKLVGTVLLVEPGDPLNKHWWEGDLRSYVNGRRTPGLHGTGHEDDHLGGWSNEFLETPYSLPMHGEPAVEMLDHNGQYNGNCSLYRLWPGINFVDGVRHSVEHGNENVQNYNYSGVAFFYVNENVRLEATDRLILGDEDSRVAHSWHAEAATDPETLTSAFEGREYKQPVTMKHLSHAAAAKFTLNVAPDSEGFFLRRTYDAAQPRQLATVLVDGKKVADWYTAEHNATLRWGERDLFIPKRFVAGKSRVVVEIRPAKGAPPWDAAEYRALCVRYSTP